VRHLKSPVSPSNPIHIADDCGKDYEGSGTEIVDASPAAVRLGDSVTQSIRMRFSVHTAFLYLVFGVIEPSRTNKPAPRPLLSR
jgi:hypothetical protein